MHSQVVFFFSDLLHVWAAFEIFFRQSEVTACVHFYFILIIIDSGTIALCIYYGQLYYLLPIHDAALIPYMIPRPAYSFFDIQSLWIMTTLVLLYDIVSLFRLRIPKVIIMTCKRRQDIVTSDMSFGGVQCQCFKMLTGLKIRIQVCG